LWWSVNHRGRSTFRSALYKTSRRLNKGDATHTSPNFFLSLRGKIVLASSLPWHAAHLSADSLRTGRAELQGQHPRPARWRRLLSSHGSSGRYPALLLTGHAAGIKSSDLPRPWCLLLFWFLACLQPPRKQCQSCTVGFRKRVSFNTGVADKVQTSQFPTNAPLDAIECTCYRSTSDATYPSDVGRLAEFCGL
jgi:hypothetical protein